MKRVTSDQQATGIFNGFKDWSCTVSSQNLHSDSDSDSERNFDSDSERNFDSDFNRQWKLFWCDSHSDKLMVLRQDFFLDVEGILFALHIWNLEN